MVTRLRKPAPEVFYLAVCDLRDGSVILRSRSELRGPEVRGEVGEVVQLALVICRGPAQMF